MSAVVVAALASGVAACGGGHDATWQQGYSYGQGAARQDYTGGPITGAAAGDACNHSLSAVPDGFGDPSSQDWTAGFMAGCEQALSVTRTAAAGSASSAAAATSASPAPTNELTCNTQMIGTETMKGFIAKLVTDQANAASGWSYAQSADLQTAENLGSYSGNKLSTDADTLANDAVNLLADANGLANGGDSTYRAVKADIARLAADCNFRSAS